MRVAAMQPGYLPYLGVFDLMKRSELFIIEDSLKFTKQDWRNRNRIRTEKEWTFLTVPVQKGSASARICDVQIDNNQPWAKRHWNLLRMHYGKAPHWKRYSPFLKETYAQTWSSLLDLDMHLFDFLAKEFAIDTRCVMLSDLDFDFGDDKTRSLVDLCLSVGATTFLEGARGKDFIEEKQFADAGVSIEFQDYECKPYPQQYDPFVPQMAAIDLLLNVGPKGAALI